jgi:hypothetical protein
MSMKGPNMHHGTPMVIRSALEYFIACYTMIHWTTIALRGCNCPYKKVQGLHFWSRIILWQPWKMQTIVSDVLEMYGYVCLSCEDAFSAVRRYFSSQYILIKFPQVHILQKSPPPCVITFLDPINLLRCINILSLWHHRWEINRKDCILKCIAKSITLNFDNFFLKFWSS